MTASRLSLNEKASTVHRIHEVRESRLFLPESVEAKVSVSDHYGEPAHLRLINLSAFGLRVQAMNHDQTLHLNQQLSQVQVRIDGHEIYQGQATVVNESQQGSVITYGLALSGYGIDVERVQAIIETQGQIGSLSGTASIIDISKKVRPDFKIQVANLNAIIQDLKIRLLNEEQRIQSGSHSAQYKKKLEEAAIDLAMSLYQMDIHKTFAAFHNLVDQLTPEEKLIHKRFFQVNFHPLLLSAPFIHRAYSKPLGYAGDFGLMVMFYNYTDDGKDLFEKFMHRYACNEPSSVANKNRVEYLAERLNQKYLEHCKSTPNGSPFKVTSVACGPAREIELFLKDCAPNPSYPIQVILIDQEKRALDYAASKIRPLANPSQLKLTLLAEDAVLGIIKGRPFCQMIQDSQVIISAGLFDYLSDRVAERLISSLFNYLTHQGEMIIGNVSKHSPDRFSMEFLMEWQLVLRDANNLLSLTQGINQEHNKSEVVSEALGLNLFLVINKVV